MMQEECLHPVHPGEVLLEEFLKPMQLSQNRLALDIGVHPRRIEVIADLLASMASEERSQVVVTTHSPTLIAAMLQKSREKPGRIKLFRCSQDGRATQVKPFEIAGPLLEDPEIREALTGPEDAQVVEALLTRGWLDD